MTRVEVIIYGVGKPDEESLGMLNNAVREFISPKEKIHDKVFYSYESYGEYIEDAVVYVSSDDAQNYSLRWFCRPEWDEEHCICIDLEDDLALVDC